MKTKLFPLFLLVVAFSLPGNVQAQEVYQHISKHTIYDFLDEVAAQRLIEINSAIKPYSRQFIADKLSELDTARQQLNKRQQKQLDFFLKDYNKEIKRAEFDTIYNSPKFFSKKTLFHTNKDKRLDALFYSADKFQVSVNPIAGMEVLVTDKMYRRIYGGEVNSYLGKGWAAYFSYRDVADSKERVAPGFINTAQVGVTKPNRPKDLSEFNESRGGLTYAWRWGTVCLVQDQFHWGNAYHSANIFSGNNPAIPHLKLRVKPTKWLEFNYAHGWLNSNVVDSVRTYQALNGVERTVFHQKYLVANMFTITPVKHLDVSFGNSTVYSDIGVHPGYLIPFFFYRSVDHAVGNHSNKAGQNGQLFLDVSSRNLKFMHLYGTLFVDEIRFSVALEEEKSRNQIGFKLGAAGHNIAKTNLGFVVEFTRSNPYAYRHGLETTTFEQNDYNLGHYLKDNSMAIYVELNYQPISNLKISAHYLSAKKGDLYPHNNTTFGGISGAAFLENIEYESTEFGITAHYEIFHDIYAKGSLVFANTTDVTESYTPDFMRGKNTFATLALNWGF
jgi:hypothetical protein